MANLTRRGYCTYRIKLDTCCIRKATTVATDPSGTREVCAQHARFYEQFGPATPIAR